MNSWAPLFSKIVDSSLWSEPDHVCKVFITLLAKKDQDQISRMTAYAIGKKCWPLEAGAEAKALDALKILSSPDTKRIEPQPYDGRRIEKVADGWLVLNGQMYEEMMRKLNRRAYKREKQAEYRQKPQTALDRAVNNAASPEEVEKLAEMSLQPHFRKDNGAVEQPPADTGCGADSLTKI